MDWKKLALCAALAAGSLNLVACGDDPGMMVPDPVTHTYVISTISIPEATGTMAAGFNLDGMVSTGEGTTCVDLSPDYTSTNDMEEGTDNGLASLLPTLAMLVGGPLDETLQAQIVDGSFLLLMEVSDINGFNNDDSVMVQLYIGSVPGGGAPMIAGATLAPGQAFDGMAIGTPQTGSITGGRLTVATPLLTLAIDTGDFMIDLPIRTAQIRADISATGLGNGAIGGSLRVEDIATAAEMIMPFLGYTVRGGLGGVADRQPQAADPTTCDALSVGILFNAVSATRN